MRLLAPSCWLRIESAISTEMRRSQAGRQVKAMMLAMNEPLKFGGEEAYLNVCKWVWSKTVGQGVFAHLRSFRLNRYVSKMVLHPHVDRLAETLEAMTTLLKLHGDNGWAEQVERCRSSIAQSDYHGVGRLLCLYGGMGSLNDVILQSGGVVPAEDNERFDALRADACRQANALARDAVRGNGR